MRNFTILFDSKRAKTFFFLFILVLVSNSTVFSQTSTVDSVEINIVEIGNSSKHESVKNSNMEFLLWFMGSKQDPNTTISAEGINTKKQIMTSGLAPNRLLIKAFLKKAVNFESAVA
ncbi:hypothetical protein FQU23_000630 [Flavobacterium sp. XN-5]|uniref:hypothetical protein n=1 Tax=Flavobacterium sp. XN-5 TaxID=2599390 RepID=UPI0011CC823E|nr:hypothetical protein [Flavobacterium sp. XN-5]NGY36017.1 hypothetical protein [Flavobacterium sp. XN-5]